MGDRLEHADCGLPETEDAGELVDGPAAALELVDEMLAALSRRTLS